MPSKKVPKSRREPGLGQSGKTIPGTRNRKGRGFEVGGLGWGLLKLEEASSLDFLCWYPGGF